MILRFYCYSAFVLGIIFMGSTSVSAMTLDETLAHAIAYNPTIGAATDNYRALVRSRFVALAPMLPQATVFYESVDTRRRHNEPMGQQIPPGEYTVDSYGIVASQTLFSSGRLYNNYRGTLAQIADARHVLQNTEQTILLAAITAHTNVLRDRAVVLLREKSVALLSEQLEATRDRFDAGVVNRTDVAQAESRQAQARSGLIAAQGDLHGSEAIYREIVGVAPENLEWPEKLPELPATIDEAQETAKRESPSLNSARAVAREAQLRTYSAIGAALPSIELTARYRKSDNDTRNPATPSPETEETTIGVRLNIPVLMGGRAVAGIQAARAAESALTKSIHIAVTGTERAVIVAWYQQIAAVSLMRARKEQIIAAERAYNGIVEENKLGTRSTLDVLDAEEELLDAQVESVRAESTTYTTSYGVLASIGRLTGQHLSLKPIILTKDNIEKTQ